MKRPPPDRAEVDEFVKAHFRGETTAQIAERHGRSAVVVAQKLNGRGAFRFERRKAKP